MAVTVALLTSIVAIALFSCSVTQAVRPAWSSAMYSGSRSWAALAPGPLMRTSLARSASASNPAKDAVATVARWGPRAMSMIDTEPSGSTWPGP